MASSASPGRSAMAVASAWRRSTRTKCWPVWNPGERNRCGKTISPPLDICAGEQIGAARQDSPRGDHVLQSAEPTRYRRPAGVANQGRQIDHRRRGAGDNAAGARQRSSAQIGVADGVEDQGVRRQRQRRVVVLGVERRDGEDRVVEQRTGGDVAAAGRDQQQHRHAGPLAAEGLRRKAAGAEGLAPMLGRQLRLAQRRQHAGQALMGGGERRLGTHGRLEFGPRGVKLAALDQQIAEIDPRGRVVRMAEDGLLIGGPRRRAVAAAQRQPRQLQQRRQGGRIAPQHVEVGALGGLVGRGPGKPPRPLQQRWGRAADSRSRRVWGTWFSAGAFGEGVNHPGKRGRRGLMNRALAPGAARPCHDPGRSIQLANGDAFGRWSSATSTPAISCGWPGRCGRPPAAI